MDLELIIHLLFTFTNSDQDGPIMYFYRFPLVFMSVLCCEKLSIEQHLIAKLKYSDRNLQLFDYIL